MYLKNLLRKKYYNLRKKNFYEIKEEELEKLLGDSSWKYEKDRVENMAKPKHSVTPITTKRD